MILLRLIAISLTINFACTTLVAQLARVEVETDDAIPSAMFEYVQRDEPDYAWIIDNRIENELGAIHQVTLTSQTWHSITWKHDLYIYEPKVVRHPTKVLLFINGGATGKKPDQNSMEIGQALANAAGAAVASLHQVPNQPLFDNRYEDDAITETWLRYLRTGDETWPLLFPMVKSAVKAMDAVQEMAKEYRQVEVDGFVITGASKRGWTSWLTSAVDERIIGTAPMVIDMLNLQSQMKHQKEMWGKFSDSINDYTEKGLVKLDGESARERRLRIMMDPYTYRAKLCQPKLIVNGTNDPYWCTDALNHYWDGLQGNDNHILQLPNSGHGLQGNTELALRSIAVFFECVASNKPFPKLHWTWSDQSRTLTVTGAPAPKTVRLWTAESDDQDFRPDRFTSVELKADNNVYSTTIGPTPQKHKAFFAEAAYEMAGQLFSQTTQIWRVD